MTIYFWYSELNQTVSEVSPQFVEIVTKNNPEILDRLSRGERVNFKGGILWIINGFDIVPCIPSIVKKESNIDEEYILTCWGWESKQAVTKRLELREENYRLCEEEGKRLRKLRDEKKERERLEEERERTRRNIIQEALDAEKRKKSKEQRDRKKNMTENEKIKALQEQECKRLREAEVKERKRLRDEIKGKYSNIPVERHRNICKILQSHVEELKFDPERLSTDFIKKIAGITRCPEVES